MSEELILSGAFFDNSMPKWATEETIKKLGLEFKKDRNLSKKQQDSVLKLLGKLVQLNTKAEKASKDEIKELRDLVKETRASTKASQDVVKELKKQTDELKKSGRVTTGAVASGGDSDGSIDTRDIEEGIAGSNKWLEKIHNRMEKMAGSLTDRHGAYNQSKQPVGSAGAAGAALSSRVERERPVDRISALRESMERASDANSSRMTASRRGNHRINALRGDMTGSSSKMARFGKGLTKALGAVRGFTGAITKLVSGLMVVIKKIPGIGTAVAAATASIGAAMDIQDIMWGSHKQYMQLLRGGFNFTKETLEDTRMDGIRFRKIIAEAGFTVEASMEIMTNNAALFNKLGMDVFERATQVAGSAVDAGSFMNRMMMDRKDILGFTSEYLSMLVRIGDTEARNQEQRNQSIERFIRTTNDFSKVTGRSLEDIKRIMSSIGEAPDVNAFLTAFNVDERDEKRSVLGALSAFGPLGDLIIKSVTAANAENLGLYADRDNAIAIQKLLGTSEHGMTIMAEMNAIARGIARGGSGFDEAALAASIGKIMDSIGPDGLQALSGSNDLRQHMIRNDQTIAEVYSAFVSLLKNDREMMRRIESGEDTMSSRVSSEEALAIQRLQQTIEAREIAMQAVMAGIADSGTGRHMLMAAVGARQTIEEGIMAATRKTADIVTDTLPAIKKMLNFLIGDEYEEISREGYEESLRRKGDSESNQNLKEFLAAQGLQSDLQAARKYDGVGRGSRFLGTANQDEINRQKDALKDQGMDAETLRERWTQSHGEEKNRIAQIIAYMASNQSEGITTAKMRREYMKTLNEIRDSTPDPSAFQDMIKRSLDNPAVATTVVSMEFAQNKKQRELEAESARIAQEKRTKEIQARETQLAAQAEAARREKEEAERLYQTEGNIVKHPSSVDPELVEKMTQAENPFDYDVMHALAGEISGLRTDITTLMSENNDLSRRQLDQSKKTSAASSLGRPRY